MNPFTQYYGQLLHQGNMLADHVRTSTYQEAFQRNAADFADKVVLDVGTGSGILAFFAIQCGASYVYAVDASDSIEIAKKLAEANGMSDRITFIKGKVEDISLPEKVDIIISEPIGFLLVHERMLESYVISRDKFLKPDGLMMPTVGSIIVAPFSDQAIHDEQMARMELWRNQNFYGIDLSSVADIAVEQYLAQPIVGYIPPSSLVSSQRTVHSIDFNDVSDLELQNFEVPVAFKISRTSLIHGIAGWFDLEFIGSQESVILSTAPESAGTHWYQCRLLLREPLAANKGQSVSGVIKFTANQFFSYDVDLTLQLVGTDIVSYSRINLKDQQYSYLNQQAT